MPRRPMTAEQKATKSLAMKAAWKRRKAAAVTTPTNGLVVTTQIVLQLQGHDLTLTREEASHLYEALGAVLMMPIPTNPPPLSAHEARQLSDRAVATHD